MHATSLLTVIYASPPTPLATVPIYLFHPITDFIPFLYFFFSCSQNGMQTKELRRKKKGEVK